MKSTPLLTIALVLGALATGACAPGATGTAGTNAGQLAKAERCEQAANRGEAAAADCPQGKSFEGACIRAGGKWQAQTTHCAMTAALCAPIGTWDAETGCVIAAASPDDCRSAENMGTHLVGEVCAITELSSDQFDQTGLGGEP